MTQLNQLKLNSKEFVALSARLTAAMRSQETARSDHLFYDPFATQLAGPEAFAFLAQYYVDVPDVERVFLITVQKK